LIQFCVAQEAKITFINGNKKIFLSIIVSIRLYFHNFFTVHHTHATQQNQVEVNEIYFSFIFNNRSKQQIKDAISDNDFLKHLDCVQVRELVESMYSRSVDAGEYVVRENEPGNHLYVSADGEFEIEVNGKVLGTLSSGKAFGELAILYNCRRTASIKGTVPFHAYSGHV
jgi:hypothetical protein